jgi:hypothetical protein
MRNVMHISFEEFAGNLTELLDKVRSDETSIVVEYGSGENVVIKRSARTQQGGHKKQGVHKKQGGRKKQSANEAQGNLNQQPPPPTLDRENVSSVGAVYDIDPNSITPG